ncbi:related to calcium-related spray protein [Phialocephala subalpina]|uniref:Related to calcium-related spray protein n=1 Tax=Phialocephala subalpina TaxID=576137 RepID=A0A1L7WDR7_9HELO|nr:related to calcium-related spray protein [Phialocephala subalpina]
MLRQISSSTISLLLLVTLSGRGLADQILQTSGFSTCLGDSNITVQNLDIQYNNNAKTVTFNVAGTSATTMNVTATLNVTAYGISVYQNSFNPCADSTYVEQLCPVPSGTFSASGTQSIPSSYASMIPSIAFSVPDISAQATLELKALDTGEDVACITSSVSNGKTVSVAAVSYVAAGVAGAALIVSGAAAIGAAAGGGSTAGSGTMSPSFTEVFTWFQGIAMNGMMSVNYPTVYRSFTKNFGFSTGIIPWTAMQTSIDNFRSVTGGNLTADSVQYLQNATLVFGSGSTVSRRAYNGMLMIRDSISTSQSNATTSDATNSTSTIETTVNGIKAYVEELSVPQANTFMTVLLIVACVIAAIAVGILFFKVVLETWALFGSFPKGLVGFRKHYWGTMARAIVQLILVLYGVWVLYCIFQFTNGDSWAAKLLAGITLALFTGVLAFFTFKIWQTAKKLKAMEGDASALYENKDFWLKYSLFYDSYKKDFWWLFVPAIVYMFAKGCVLAAADGHGLTQTVAQLIIECLMLGLLIWNRPYERRSGNVINIFIQVVRALSVVCILVFVEELGIAQTTQTVTGVVLIAVQSVLTGVLAILIAVNAIIMCCKENPHRKRRKEAEKMNRDLDNLTPLDARNSLLMDPTKLNSSTTSYEHDPKAPLVKTVSEDDSFLNEPANPYSGATPMRPYTPQSQRPFTPENPFPARPFTSNSHRTLRSMDSHENLVQGAAPLGGEGGSPPQQPTIPRIPPQYGAGGGYRGVAY